jgi:hypothetical protein
MYGQRLERSAANTGFWRWCAQERFSHRYVGSKSMLKSPLTGAVTVAMSALWQKQLSALTTLALIRQPLELRHIPHLALELNTWHLSSYVDAVLGRLFYDFETSWMYGAAIQLTLNGTEPEWSKDGWSFVPPEHQDLVDITNLHQGEKQAIGLRFRTPAIRARLECNNGAYFDDCWTPAQDNLANATIYRQTLDTTRFPTVFYQDVNILFAPDRDGDNSSCHLAGAYNKTTVLPAGAVPQCCPEGNTENPGTLSMGYWTPYSMTSREFNVHWVHGLAQMFPKTQGGEPPQPLYWLEKPRLAIANCTPVIEQAHADVTADVFTGQVREFMIIDEPSVVDDAWAEPFAMREPYDAEASEGTWISNITTRFVILRYPEDMIY